MSAFDSNPATITKWLRQWRAGDENALEQLTGAIYHELHRLAAISFLSESAERTLQPTALVHELYLRLDDVQHLDWQSRGQFLAVASKMMRNILVDHARKRRAAKRGGGMERTEHEPSIHDVWLDVDILVVHEALDRFEVDYPRQSRVVELRFFGGLTSEETAEALRATGVASSLRTVERDWKFARAWLENAVGGPGAHAQP
jgi:RNA polymerase sigma factor (TIGR02999 family)